MTDEEIIRAIEEYLDIDINSAEGETKKIYELLSFGKFILKKNAAQQNVRWRSASAGD